MDAPIIKESAREDAFFLEYRRTGNASEAYRLVFNCAGLTNDVIHDRARRLAKKYKIGATGDSNHHQPAQKTGATGDLNHPQPAQPAQKTGTTGDLNHPQPAQPAQKTGATGDLNHPQPAQKTGATGGPTGTTGNVNRRQPAQQTGSSNATPPFQSNSTIKYNSSSRQNRQTTNLDDVKDNADILAIIGEHVALKKVGHEWEGCCPFHNERIPSFKVDPNKGLWNCFGCGKGGDVIAFVQAIRGCGFNDAVDELDGNRYRDASVIQPKSREQKRTITAGLPVPDHAPPPMQRHRTLGGCTGMWEYRNDIGQLVEYRYRFDLPDRKIILPLSWCRNEKTGAEDWDWKQAPAPRPLYRLHDILSRPDAPILIVEGEKTADAAVKIFQEYVVTTSSGGCNAADSSDWSPMAGRCVVIWPDNDQPGNQYAEKVKRLVRKASEIRIVQVPRNFPEKWDLADPLPDGWTLEMLRELMDGATVHGSIPIEIHASNHTDETWQSDLIRSRTGIVPNMANVLTALRHAVEWKGVFGFNEFAGRVEVMSRPPWAHGEWRQQEVKDEHLTFAAEWMQRREINVSSNTVGESIYAASMAHRFHPVRQFLASLKWDGVKRISYWLSDFVGAEDNEYTSAVGRKWLIGAVARVFEPGCKMDTILILEGEQGIGKSSVFRTLAGNDWFCDHLPDLNNKDAAIQLQGVWILEHAELDSLNRGEVGQVKKFVSSQTDRFRPPFGRVSVDHPRGCVFCGSVNPSGNGYLKDSTGARRFWPIACNKINLEGLSDAREQLLAEAVAAYHSGEFWWLSQELEAMATTEQAARMEHDAWADKIKRYIFENSFGFTTVGDILKNVLGVEESKWTQNDQNRVSKCLKILNWVPVRKRILGVIVRGYMPDRSCCDGSTPRPVTDPSQITPWNHEEMSGVSGVSGHSINRVCARRDDDDPYAHLYAHTCKELEKDPTHPTHPTQRREINGLPVTPLDSRPVTDPSQPHRGQENVIPMRRAL